VPGRFATKEPDLPAEMPARSAAWVFLAFAENGKIAGKTPENPRKTPKTAQ
jgi:hypothetical protein